MIYWLMFAISFIVLFIYGLISLSSKDKYSYSSTEEFWGTSSIICFIFLFFSTMLIATSYFNKEATYNTMVQERNSLQYQLDYGVYEPLSSNENFDNSQKVKLYQKVEDFNKELANYKGKKNNFWIGIFYQADLDKVDYIQYPDRDSWIDKADGVKKYEFTIS